MENGLQIFDSNGENGRTIYENKGAQVAFPSWSPDGKQIAFGVGSYFGGHAKPATIAVVDADGRGFRNLTDGPGNAGFPSWSPDGEWIIFTRSRLGWKDEAFVNDSGPQPFGELFAMYANASGVRQLTDNQWEDALPAFQPKPK